MTVSVQLVSNQMRALVPGSGSVTPEQVGGRNARLLHRSESARSDHNPAEREAGNGGVHAPAPVVPVGLRRCKCSTHAVTTVSVRSAPSRPVHRRSPSGPRTPGRSPFFT